MTSQTKLVRDLSHCLLTMTKSSLSTALLALLGVLSNEIEAMSSSKPIRKVAIVGAGIAGLCTANALVSAAASSTTDNDDIEVSVFDARPGLDRGAGAGVQINGGLYVLGKIRPSLQQAVIDAGQPLEMVRSRAKPWSPNKPFETLLELSFRESIEKIGGYTEETLIQNGQVLWTSIMRGALQETLYNELPPDCKKNVQFQKTLSGITGGESGAMCQFTDGSTAGPFDIVIGCDGIKSAVKEYVDSGKISKDSAEREGAAAGIYTGLRIRYAVRDGKASDPQDERSSITQYFGDSAYCFQGTFGAGKGRPNTKCAFITYLDEDYIGPIQKQKPKQLAEENADWTQDVRKSSGEYRSIMLKQLDDCQVPSDELKTTVEEADRFFDLGVYAHNPFCSWFKEIPGSNGAFSVVVGDAAHALPPFLGQGANQALQDAYCLSKRIHDYNAKVSRGEEANLSAYLKEYESTRWPAAFQIFWKAAFLGYLETGGTNGFYAKFRDVFFKTMGKIGVARQVLLSAATPKV